MLSVVAGVVSLNDGISDLTALDWLGQTSSRRLPRLAWSVLLTAMLLHGSYLAYRAVHAYGWLYTPLGLPGSRLIRLPEERVRTIRAVAQNLRDSCDTYLSFPGLNSYYFWSEKEPPTGYNVGNWMYLLSDHQQAELVNGLGRFKRPCLLIDRPTLENWMRGRALGSSITRYANHKYQYLTTVYDHELWVKRETERGTVRHGRKSGRR